VYSTSNRQDDLIPSFYALAARLEGEGQLNNAKLLRAAAEAINRQAAYQQEPPAEKSQLLKSLRKAIGVLSAYDLNPDLIHALHFGADAMESGRLPLIHETPDAYVCRTCGYLALDEPQTNCPTCAARPQTFIRFPATYWLEAFNLRSAQDAARCGESPPCWLG
jgi:hypothetical protein